MFGNAKSTLFESTELLTPGFVASIVHISYPVRVESLEPYRIFLSESSDDDVVELKRNPSLLFPISEKSIDIGSNETRIQSNGSCQNLGGRPLLPTPKDFVSLIDCLKKSQICPWDRSEFKLIDYASMHFEKVRSLLTSFNGDVMFELPLVMLSTSTSMQRQMEGKDKKFNGHIWSNIQSTNIINDYGLTFHSSGCVGYICCMNDASPKLRRSKTHNITKWYGH
jgi:hypothetical protein